MVTEEQKHFIRDAFQKMKSKEDFTDLLNYAKAILFGEKTIPLKLKQVTYYSNININRHRYTRFQVPKKSGGVREINAPVNGLKVIQKCLNLILFVVYEQYLSKSANGFIPNKSIVDNAKNHVDRVFVYNIDLKDFFPSINQPRVWGRLKVHPFNLSEGTGRLEINNIICALCCEEMEVERQDEQGNWSKVVKNVLPQGAPTSPILTNIICQQLDFYLTAVAKRFGLTYSRYADDITFSSQHNVYKDGDPFLVELNRVISAQGFHIQPGKVRLQRKGYRQEVTGLVVSDRVNLPQRYIKNLRLLLHFWEVYGYENAHNIFIKRYIKDKGYIKNGNAKLVNVMAGKLCYLKMIKGASNPCYKKLAIRFSKLTQSANTLSEDQKSRTIQKLDVTVLEELPTVKNAKTNQKPSNIKLPLRHTPKELVSLLGRFSANDSALKYTTHNWDAGRDSGLFKDLPDFLSQAKTEYNTFSPQLKKLSNSLNGKIFHFLFNEQISLEGWGVHRIKFGWSSPELLNAFEKNKTLIPEDMTIPESLQLRIENETIQKFGQIINIFKNEIEIRDDNDQLVKLILDKHDKFLTSFSEPVVSNLSNKTFYTDVQWLGKALDLMMQNIQKRPQHPIVSYQVTVDNPQVLVLEILHQNSFKEGMSVNDKKFQLTGGDFAEISKYLKNLCDWSIESRFREGSYRINFLASDNEVGFTEKIEKAEGFKYVLKFYK